MLKKNCQVPLHPQHVESKIRYCSLRSQQLGQNPFQITCGDGILPRMSRDFAIIHGKTPRGILPVNSNINPAIKSSAVLLELPPEMGYDRFRELFTKKHNQFKHI